ncbi:hypothetical protein FB107DRAFT_225249 [Schizophyllum commune]
MAAHDEPTATGQGQASETVQVESSTLDRPVSNQIASDRVHYEDASGHTPPTMPLSETVPRNIDTLKRNITIYKLRNQKLAKRVEELEGHKDETDGQCERLEKERAALEKEREGLARERDACIAKLDTQGAMQKEIDALRSELGTIKSAWKPAEEDRTRIEGELARSNSAREGLSVRTSAADAHAVAPGAHAEDTESRAKDALVRIAEAERCVLAARTRAADAEACTSAAEARAATCEDRVVLSEGRATFAETRAAAIADELCVATDALKAAETQASHAITEKQELLRSLQVQSSEFSRIQDELAKAKDELAQAHTEIGKVKDTLAGTEAERLEMQVDFMDLRDRFIKFSCRFGFSNPALAAHPSPSQSPQSAHMEVPLLASIASAHADDQQPPFEGASVLSRPDAQSGSSGENGKALPAKQPRKRPHSPDTVSVSEGTIVSKVERPRLLRTWGRATPASGASNPSSTSLSERRSGSLRRATRGSAKPVAWEMLKPKVRGVSTTSRSNTETGKAGECREHH